MAYKNLDMPQDNKIVTFTCMFKTVSKGFGWIKHIADLGYFPLHSPEGFPPQDIAELEKV